MSAPSSTDYTSDGSVSHTTLMNR